MSCGHTAVHHIKTCVRYSGFPNRQCWASYFVKVTSYILLATELFSYSYILPIK